MLLRRRLYMIIGALMLASAMMTESIRSGTQGITAMSQVVGIAVPAAINFLFVIMTTEFFVFYRIRKVKEDLDSIKYEKRKGKGKIQGYIGDDELGDISSYINELLKDNRHKKENARKSEELYHSLVDEVPFLIHRFKPDGTITFANKPYTAAYGSSDGKIVGENVYDIIEDLGGDRKRMQRELSYLRPEASSGTSFYDSPKKNGNGSEKWSAWINQAFFDEFGRTTEYQSIGIDMYQKAKEGLDNMIGEFLDMVYFVNKDGELKYVSPTSESVLGHKAEDMIGEKFSDFVHEKDRGEVETNLEAHINGEKNTTIQELRMRNSKDQYSWVQTAIDSVYDAQGDVSNVAINARDITKMKQVTTNFSNILTCAQDGALKIGDQSGNTRKKSVITLVWSPKEKGMRYVSKTNGFIGYKKKDLLKGKIKFEDLICPEDLQEYRRYFELDKSAVNDAEGIRYRLKGGDKTIYDVIDKTCVSEEKGHRIVCKQIEFTPSK